KKKKRKLRKEKKIKNMGRTNPPGGTSGQANRGGKWPPHCRLATIGQRLTAFDWPKRGTPSVGGLVTHRWHIVEERELEPNSPENGIKMEKMRFPATLNSDCCKVSLDGKLVRQGFFWYRLRKIWPKFDRLLELAREFYF